MEMTVRIWCVDRTRCCVNLAEVGYGADVIGNGVRPVGSGV